MLQTLDTIVGVIFTFLLFSLVVSAVQEVLAAGLRLRGRALKTGLDAVLKNLGDQQLMNDFWAHGLIATLQPSGKTPSYIPSSSIAAALLHIAAGNKPGEAVDVATLKVRLVELGAGGQANLATVLANSLELTGPNPSLATLQANVEKWVDTLMERISSMYHRRTRLWLLLIALIFAGLMNVDAVTIWQRIQSDKSLRESLVAQAEKVKVPPITLLEAKPGETNAALATQEKAIKEYQERLKQITDLELPIGWTPEAAKGYAGFWSGFLHICGILLSAFAASLGAPFWFDLLQRFMNIRSAVKPLLKPGKTT
jgi:hypothetical protein